MRQIWFTVKDIMERRGEFTGRASQATICISSET